MDLREKSLDALLNNNTFAVCTSRYQHFVPPENELWCNWAWDTYLCWPPTKSSTTARQRCPLENGVDTTKFVEKRCGENGLWEGRGGTSGKKESPNGWTNYTPCYTPEMLLLNRRLYAGSIEETEEKIAIAKRTRVLELVGLSISLTALLISLAIFCRFRSLRNTRTRIHKNLFVAMVIQVLIRLVLYIDQALLRTTAHGLQKGIDNTPGICEASYVLLEYATTAMFMWMFIEGLFLHNMVTVTVFQETSHYRIYRIIGWGCPVLMTLVWAIITALYYNRSKCWWGYNFSLYFWILEGPRLAVILLNFLFLLNILRVLVVKLRRSHTSEIEQVLKAVRAAVVLLPLLGITNVISMIDAPLDSAWKFALWSYVTYFLTSFQGFFIATLYCFLNGEVRMALDKTISVYLALRGSEQQRRQSSYNGCQQQRGASVIEVEEDEVRRRITWRSVCCGKASSKENTPSLRKVDAAAAADADADADALADPGVDAGVGIDQGKFVQ